VFAAGRAVRHCDRVVAGQLKDKALGRTRLLLRQGRAQLNWTAAGARGLHSLTVQKASGLCADISSALSPPIADVSRPAQNGSGVVNKLLTNFGQERRHRSAATSLQNFLVAQELEPPAAGGGQGRVDQDEANPGMIVTSLRRDQGKAMYLYEKVNDNFHGIGRLGPIGVPTESGVKQSNSCT
jgi:hypothetical protein